MDIKIGICDDDPAQVTLTETLTAQWAGFVMALVIWRARYGRLVPYLKAGKLGEGKRSQHKDKNI